MGEAARVFDAPLPLSVPYLRLECLGAGGYCVNSPRARSIFRNVVVIGLLPPADILNFNPDERLLGRVFQP